MKKTDYFGFFLLITIGIFGYLVNGFSGGIMTGFAISILVFFSIGKYLAKKVTARIQKGINDFILHHQNN